jgi:hypothetical protein
LSRASDTPVTLGTPVTFDITTMTNPSTANKTFFARIATFATGAAATSYTSTTPGTYIDYGGIAMSTAKNISITAKVMETLTFCVSGTTLLNGNCTSATDANLVLGHNSPATLDSTAVDAASAYTQLSTNASTGAVIRMKNTNSCADGGLSANGGTTCAIVGNGSTAAAIAAGQAKFGLFVAASANNTTPTAGTGTVAPAAIYNDGTHTTVATPSSLYYGMESGASGVGSTYGSTIATSSGAPCSFTNNQLVFGASAALTTPAGVYTNNEILIATGTF